MTGSRDPFVLDVRSLHRQPGSMTTVSRNDPAPAGLGVGLARVPEGSPIALDLRLESVLEGVLVSGTADVEVAAECSRCLDPVSWQQEVEISELFRYPATDARGAVAQEDGEEPSVRDDRIDLEPALRDAVVLDLPLAPLCSEDCLGLCAICGVRLQDSVHTHEENDPRWAALATLLDTDKTEGRADAGSEAEDLPLQHP